ncbi:MAG: sigma-70 family RNA polymerase sigma factor [Acidobacteriota bacterium]|nr:sigma-70 family RNA polymerase sigma factor [Acidobacteriota bacterium]
MDFAEKHKLTIDDALARLVSRAGNSRRLTVADLRGRVGKSIEKYVLRVDENASSAEIKAFIDALAADDLCLIIACEKGDEKAWEDLVKNYDGAVKAAARKISQNAEDAEDLAGSIWAELYGFKRGKDGELKTKLAYYSGRGSLGGWLRAVVSQLAIDGFRKESKFVQIEESREFENLANDSAANSDSAKIIHASANPEDAFSAKKTQKDVSIALKQAISNLDAEDKLILKLYYFDDLKLKDIGAALGFHEATASRKMARIHAEIRKAVEKILVKDFGWTPEETRRHLTNAASKLDIGLEKMFAVWLCLALVQEFWK